MDGFSKAIQSRNILVQEQNAHFISRCNDICYAIPAEKLTSSRDVLAVVGDDDIFSTTIIGTYLYIVSKEGILRFTENCRSAPEENLVNMTGTLAMECITILSKLLWIILSMYQSFVLSVLLKLSLSKQCSNQDYPPV